MSNNVLVGGLQMFAKMLADRLHVPLIFGAKKAHADGVSIHLPVLPLDSQNASVLALGYIVREASRLRSSDISSQPLYNQGLLYDLWYLIEEVWIELQAHRKYLGAKKTLNDLASLLVDKKMIPQLDDKSSPAEIFLSHVHFRLRTSVLDQSVLSGHADLANSMVSELLPPSVFDKINRMMDGIKTSTGTNDNVKLAQEIIALLDAEDQEPPSNDQQESQSQDSESSQEDSTSCESDNSNPSDDQESDENDVDSETEAEGDEEAQSGSESQSGSSDSQDDSDDASIEGDPAGQGPGQSAEETQDQSEGTSSDTSSKDAESSDEEVAGAQSVSGNGDSDMAESTKSMRSIVEDQTRADANDLSSISAKALNEVGQRNDDGSNFKVVMSEAQVAKEWLSGVDMLQDTRSSTNALRARLNEMLEAQKRCKREYAKKGKRIVASRVWMLKAGNTRVFERETEGSKIDTAVLVLLDRSESMDAKVNTGSSSECISDANQTVLSLACQSTLALMLAMSQVDGIHSAAAAFPAPHGHERGVSLLTDFHERAASTASRYASLGVFGGTPMAEALLWSIYKLMSQKAERRILFVQTDGMPSRKPETEKILKMAVDAGIEIVGLGIKVDISHLIPISSRIDSIDEMPSKVFQLLQSKLTLPIAA